MLAQVGDFQTQNHGYLATNLGAAIFTNHSVTLMCICVKECPTFGGFSISYIGNMATN
jgi:hypothetical protein